MTEKNPPITHLTVDQAMQLALQHQQAGRLRQAEAVYRQILAHSPNHASALYNLGLLARHVGRNDDAFQLIAQAIRLKPDLPGAHRHLAGILFDRGDLDRAVQAYAQAIQLNPDDLDAHHELGYAFYSQGKFDESIASYRRALQIKPDSANTANNLGATLIAAGRLLEAVAVLTTLVQSEPRFAKAHNNLATALKDLGRTSEAIVAFNTAIQIQPDFAEAHNNLGNVYKNLARLDDAIASFTRAVELKPDYAVAHSNRVFTLLFHPAHDAAANAAELRRWNQQHAQSLRHLIRPHSNDADPNRRLRIGYVSPDFRNHVVCWNLLPLLRRHDRDRFHVICYSNLPRHDSYTHRLRAQADGWRDIFALTDQQTADLIRRDEIDILVDLALHTAGNRLLVFARKPAPIQVTYLGYCGATGLETIDYRFSDPFFDPPDADLSVYVEQTMRLPRSYWCYEPGGLAPDPTPPPMLPSGLVTFGCLNNFAKVSSAALDLWARVLTSIPPSRLLIHADSGNHRDAMSQCFARAGITADRLEFVPRQSWIDYMRTYDRIDIALDPFPYTGGITTCDALWMGVPAISLRGPTAVGRGGYSILSNLGLADLVASTPEQYLRIAAELSGDSSHLAELRRTLRDRMRASPLMDAPALARDIETAYRKIWRTWCEKERK